MVIAIHQFTLNKTCSRLRLELLVQNANCSVKLFGTKLLFLFGFCFTALLSFYKDELVWVLAMVPMHRRSLVSTKAVIIFKMKKMKKH